jgi:hypothetical protein
LSWVKGGARSFDLEIYFERNRNNAADMPSGHSSLASDPTTMTLGVQRAKEEGTAARHRRNDFELASTFGTEVKARKRTFGTLPATFARPFDPHVVLVTPRR